MDTDCVGIHCKSDCHTTTMTSAQQLSWLLQVDEDWTCKISNHDMDIIMLSSLEMLHSSIIKVIGSTINSA